MTAGDYGNTTLVFQAQYNLPFDDSSITFADFTGVTSVTLIALGPDSVRRPFTCTAGDTTATYEYTPAAATDFPVNGVYNCELQLSYASGGPKHSLPFTITVYPAY